MSKHKKRSAPQVAVWLPAKLEPVYSNHAIISHAESEIVIDFAKLLPSPLTVQVDARIIMTPHNAWLLLYALQENLAKHLRRYGAHKPDAESNPFAGMAPDWLVEDE